MQTLTIDRIRELDVICASDICGFLRHVCLATLFHKDNLEELRNMAQRVGVSLERFSSYVWLQAYIKELAHSCNEVPAPEDVAQQFGVDWSEFEKYFLSRSEALRDDLAELDEPRQRSFLLDPWEEEEDLLEDLQDDAGLQGD